MGDLTRNLFPFAIGRNAVHTVIPIFSTKTHNNDGSINLVNQPEIPYLSRVDVLTPSDIQRLQGEGVTINEGLSVSIVENFLVSPDSIKFNDQILKVVSFTFKEGVSIMIVSNIPGEV